MFLLGLGNLGLTDRDEGSNAEAGREMLETGHWISPTLNYEPRFAKPALVYWILSGSFALFGVSEFAARLPSALFGIGLIFLQYQFLRRIIGPSTAFVGALMLLLNVEVIAINRMVLTDPELVFFTTVAAYSFWRGMQGGRPERRWFWGWYGGMALAMLAKGPVGIVIPVLAMAPYLTLTRQWSSFWKHGYPLLGTVVFLIVTAPWYLAMFAIHGADYLAAAQANTTGRFADPMEGHGGTILFFVPVLLFGFFPWSAFLPVPLYEALKSWKRFREPPWKTEEHLAFFAALWVISVFIFFSLSATRLPHYLYPLFPPAAILTALFWRRCSQEAGSRGLTISVRLLVILGYLLGIALASAPAVYHAVLRTIVNDFPAAAHLELGLLPAVLGVIVVMGVTGMRYLLNQEEKRKKAFWMAAGMMGCFSLVVVVWALPKVNSVFLAPPQELAMIAGFNLGPHDQLIQVGRKLPSLGFYAKRKVYQVNSGDHKKIETLIHFPGRKMVVLPSHQRSTLLSPMSGYPVVLEINGFSLLSSKPVLQETIQLSGTAQRRKDTKGTP